MVFMRKILLKILTQKIKEISYNDYLNKEIKVMDSTAISLAKDRTIL